MQLSLRSSGVQCPSTNAAEFGSATACSSCPRQRYRPSAMHAGLGSLSRLSGHVATSAAAASSNASACRSFPRLPLKPIPGTMQAEARLGPSLMPGAFPSAPGGSGNSKAASALAGRRGLKAASTTASSQSIPGSNSPTAALVEGCFTDPRAAAVLKTALATLSMGRGFSDLQAALILQVWWEGAL